MAYIESLDPRRKIPSPPAERRRGRHCVIDLPPEHFDAITELAQVENVPLPTLISRIINIGLGQYLARRASRVEDGALS
jgi:hypothetical protein